MEEIIKLRKYLHQHPELSNQEFRTAETITAFMADSKPDEVIRLGRTGRAFVFRGAKPGRTTIFRAELDALPIKEKNDLPYASGKSGVSHVCGHDGHMAILGGLGRRIAQDRPSRGKAVLLFQPAEEVEQGAKDVMEDPAFRTIEPDGIFALHNIPGLPMHQVVIKEGSFAAASRGLTVWLEGKTAHAGEPEKGINPADALARMVIGLKQLNEQTGLFRDLAFVTIIHILLGEIAFGTSPGHAELRVTLRAYENKDMELLCGEVEKRVAEIAQSEKLDHEYRYTEIFPATVNDPDRVDEMLQAAREIDLPVRRIHESFRWSEDFGYYTQKYSGGYVGLGAGENQPALHHPDYDFPDEIIESGIRLFQALYRKLHS